MSFDQFILQKQYEKIRGLGDRLDMIKNLINWNKFRNIIGKLYNNEKTGRPNHDEVVMIKILLLQQWYTLSDEELEYQIHDRISFRKFLDFPEKIPDYSTVWRFRERLSETNTLKKVWTELQHQMDNKGLTVKSGVIQDASFIEADLGRKKHYEEKKAEKRGEKIDYSNKQKAHMDADGTFSVKHGQVHYGYKLHEKSDVDYDLIRAFEVTTASLHDNQIDLIKPGDIAAYRDKGYAGKPIKHKGVLDRTMKKAAREKPLTKKEKAYNKKISHIRAPGERQFSVIKNIFKGGYTRLKKIARVTVQEMFVCFAYNLYQLVTLIKKGTIPLHT